MHLLKSKHHRTWDESTVPDTGSFWASYSDLMAGVLMVFALTATMTILSVGKRLEEPTDKVRKWREVVQELCSDEQFENLEGASVDCNSGELIISSDKLQFGFDSVSLGVGGKELLRKVVPSYLDIIRKNKDLEPFIESIEIAGHTDRYDQNNANPLISRERAGAVLDFLMSEPEMQRHKGFMETKSISSGYAATMFPEEKCKTAKCAEARRVVVAVRLDHSEVLGEFLEILNRLYKND